MMRKVFFAAAVWVCSCVMMVAQEPAAGRLESGQT